MSFVEISILLFLVVDPIGNVPFILALLKNVPRGRFAAIVLRENLVAFVVLLLFAWQGDVVFRYLSISSPALSIAGGLILFLISLHMIFKGSDSLMEGEYRTEPTIVPIAMPSIAGPSSITTVMLLKSQGHVPTGRVMLALTLVMVLCTILLLAARGIQRVLGHKGLHALDRFMGMLLNVIAVNMILTGIRLFIQSG